MYAYIYNKNDREKYSIFKRCVCMTSALYMSGTIDYLNLTLNINPMRTLLNYHPMKRFFYDDLKT